MHEVTQFYDQLNAAVIGWTAALTRACVIQPTSHPELYTAETITQLTGLLPLYPFDVPEGMVAVGPMSIEIVDGAAYKRYATITVEDHEAARAAWEAEEAERIEAERVAAEAAEAAYLEGYDVLPRPLQGKFETPAPDGHVYAFEVDPDTEEPFCVQRMSTRKSNATHATTVAERRAERKAHRDRIAAIKNDLDSVETAIDQIDVTAGGTLGVAIAATTGVNKAAFQEVRKVLVDIKAALKNLRQATEKLRKDAR
jgi:hypothetical protein